MDALIQQAVLDGVVDERNLPFWIPSSNPEAVGLLLVHGFGSSPWEMRLLGDKMAESGYSVLGIRLPGHGTEPEDLEKRTMEEWVRAVQEGIELLARYCSNRVLLAGQSTGALVGMVATESYRVEGLLLLSPFLKTRHLLSPWAGYLYPFRRWRHRTIPDAESHCYYEKQPIKAIHQINRLIRRIKRGLPKYRHPVMIISADGDATIDPYSAVKIYRRYGCPRKTLHLLGPSAPHVLTTTGNPYLAEVLKLSRAFFQQRD